MEVWNGNQKRFLLVLVLLTTSFSLAVFNSVCSQTETQVQWLLRFSEQKSEQWKTERAAAESLANKLGKPVKVSFPGGGGMELQRFQNGIPVYYTTFNLVAAKTISTNKVWPGGGLGWKE